MDRLNRILKCCHSRKNLIIYCIFAVILSVFFQSCELEPNETDNKVSVQLLNNDGYPVVGEEWVGASIGDYPVALPNYLGYCKFENVQTPYDLRVYYWGGSYLYKQVNARNLHLALLRYLYSTENEFMISVKFPEIQQHEYGYLRFISPDMFEQDYNNSYLIRAPHNSANILIQIPADKSTISGKLIFFKCFANNSNTFEIYSFKNIGVKDVTFQKGENDTIVFSQQDIEFDPPENSVQVNISYPQFYLDRYLIIKLSFPGYNKHSDIMIGYYRSPSNANIQMVPVNLNLPFFIKAESQYRDEQHSIPFEIWPRKIINILPGEAGIISHKKVDLISPQNNEVGIKNSSMLRAEESGEKGIYVFCIGKDSSAGSFYTITDKSSVMLGDMASNYFQISPNSVYSWKVGKLSTFTSIDEFVSEPYIFQEKFNTIEFSDIRYFKTAP